MGRRRRALPQCSSVLIHLESRSLEPLDEPLGELAPGIIGCVFAEESAEKIPAPREGEADREYELGAERAMVHREGSRSVLERDVIAP